ncbi:PEP/pyruvate-binding domain-containing protein [Actinophytocola sp.]|uniref:PEP/pyruvate-binding domain-containing protein n=1 Tax=Actinophytocola sp. TaxID=1872138 RepID=UPI0025C11F50|nr:PEP/pyruvate-binding domain-containing protein [Actinophytocola sp.]
MLNKDSDWLLEHYSAIADPELSGHKFARQAALAGVGFPIPRLACVPATVFDHVVGPECAASLGTDLAAPERAQALRRRVREIGVPNELQRILDDRFDGIAGPAGLVAVRACVVPRPGDEESGEDSATDPFAGLSDSFLYVRRADVADRVAACWASAFNSEAVLYRAHRGMDPFAARVAVGVQRMVMGVRSFVAFTRNPLDGAHRCVVAAAYGIGEGVVQEKADVDHFFVDRVSGEIEAHVEVKSRAVGWDPERSDHGPVDIPVEPSLAALPVLADDELREITAVAARVEQHFGAPQDIEGTISADGRLHLVQARPVAGLARPEQSEHAGRADGNEYGRPPILWDNNNITESFPGVSCALTYSVGRELFEVAFTDLYRRMGVPARVIRRNRPRLRRMIGYLDGHIYYAIDNWYRLHGMMRCFRPLWSTWEEALGVAGRESARGPVRRTARVFHLAEIAARLLAHPRRVRDFLRWWDGYHARLDVSRMGPSEVVGAYRELWTQLSSRWGVTLVNGVFLFTATWAANRMLRRWAPAADRSVLNGMLSGGQLNRSAMALHSAVALASQAATSPALRDAILADTELRQLWAELTAGGYGQEFADALREHLRRYGDRGLQDLKLEAVTPREEPWTVLHAVRAYLRQGQTVRASVETAEKVHRAARRELRRHCRNPVKRAVLHVAFTAMRTLLRVREDTRFCRSQLFGDLRALLLRLGSHLVAARRLDQPKDVLDLTVDEVLGAFDGTMAGADLRALAAVRAAERARWIEADHTFPPRLATDPDRPVTLALATAVADRRGSRGEATDSSGVLVGLASCAGTVRGRAMVVLDPSVNADGTRDRVLVARATDPGWLFLMMSAKALVVERGTLLSHTAITGRLLGIPTVVALPDATTRIPDGSLVEVDGAAGTVRILDGES